MSPSISRLLGDLNQTTRASAPTLAIETNNAFPEAMKLQAGSQQETAAATFLQFIVFLLSNHYMDFPLSMHPSHKYHKLHKIIMEWLQEENFGSLLHRMLSVNGPTSDALVRALFPYAIEGGALKVTRMFLDFGCDPNMNLFDRSGYKGSFTTALGLACEKSDPDLVTTLLAAGADPNKLSGDKCPLVLAIQGRRTRQASHVVLDDGSEFWYESYVSQDDEGDKRLIRTLHSLLKAGAQINGSLQASQRPLVEAVRMAHEDTIKFLIKEGADVSLCDKYRNSPLFVAFTPRQSLPFAAIERMLSTVRILVESGAKLNDCFKGTGYHQKLKRVPFHNEDREYSNGKDFLDDVMPLDAAIEANSLELLLYLLVAGARPGPFTLAHAVRKNNTGIVKVLLDIGVVEIGVPPGMSALMQAVSLNRPDMFRLTFGTGCAQQDAETLNLLVKTAAKGRSWDMVRQLVHEGRQYPSSLAKLSLTLKDAIICKQFDLVDQILRIGVKPNTYNAVHAFESGDESMIKKILAILVPWSSYRTDLATLDDYKETSDVECKVYGLTCEDLVDPPLLAAVRFGNCDYVKYLLEQDELLEDSGPLVAAIEHENSAMIDLLLETECPIDMAVCKHRTITTPLHCAVVRKQTRIVRKLLENGAVPDIGWRDCDGLLVDDKNWIRPPLLKAVEDGSVEIASMLLEAGADVNYCNPRTSILSCAIRGKNPAMLELVLDWGADALDSMALLAAVERKDIALSKRLLAWSIPPGHQRRPHGFVYRALCEAVKQEWIEMVELLLQTEVNLKRRSDTITPLGIAVTEHERSNMDIISRLLQAGADPNHCIGLEYIWEGRRTALGVAVQEGDEDLISLFMNYGANPNGNPGTKVNRTPLQLACEKDRLRVVQILLNNGADINAPASWYNGATALQLAAINGNLSIIATLLNHGADMNAPAAKVNGRTALEGAAENGRLDAVRALLNAGVGIHGPYEAQFNRAIQFAKEKGYISIQHELLSKRVNAAG